MKYTMTNETIQVTTNGRVHVVRKGAPNFFTLREALLEEDFVAAAQRLTVAKAVSDWAKGKFKLKEGVVLYDGIALPQELNSRILQMATKGEDPTAICLFWEKLQKNPSKRSVDQLWSFLAHQGIPLTKNGNFLAYKGVRDDYKDAHSGRFDNSPGAVNEMPRNQISDDPKEACHEGFHVGALEYARSFSQRTVVCEVDPSDVVCVPYDHSAMKMRVAKYKVIGNHNGQLLSNTVNTAEVPDLDDQDDDRDQDDYYEDPDYEFDRDEPEETPKPTPTLKVSRQYARIHALDNSELLEETLEKLRDYAANCLKIVGASRVPGGKIALISLIEKVRS